MTVSSAQYHQFVEQAIRHGEVFTFTEVGEYLIYKVHDHEVIPFWSSRARVDTTQQMHEKYRKYGISQLALFASQSMVYFRCASSASVSRVASQCTGANRNGAGSETISGSGSSSFFIASWLKYRRLTCQSSAISIRTDPTRRMTEA